MVDVTKRKKKDKDFRLFLYRDKVLTFYSLEAECHFLRILGSQQYLKHDKIIYHPHCYKLEIADSKEYLLL
jgi:hypothetical protein